MGFGALGIRGFLSLGSPNVPITNPFRRVSIRVPLGCLGLRLEGSFKGFYEGSVRVAASLKGMRVPVGSGVQGFRIEGNHLAPDFGPRVLLSQLPIPLVCLGDTGFDVAGSRCTYVCYRVLTDICVCARIAVSSNTGGKDQ